MDIALSSDQELLLETTRRFLESECPIASVRAWQQLPEGFDREFWRRGAELGWTAMLIPEELGGGNVSGNGLLDLALIAEAMGRRVAAGPLLPVNVVADTLARAGTPEQHRRFLGDLMSGDALATWAFVGREGVWDSEGVGMAAVAEGRGWVVNGTASFVQDAAAADWFLVTARTDHGMGQFIVAAEDPGVAVTPLDSLDIVRRFGEVRFDDVGVSEGRVVGPIGEVDRDITRQLHVALVLQNAETVGATDRVLEFTLEYCQDRVAFGRPIGSYQALKHRLADMKTWLEGCFATSNASARAVAADGPDAAELVSVAKSYIAERCIAIIQDCVQLHGGMGVTWEHDLHLYLRRVTQNGAVYGSPRQHRERLAALLDVA